MKSKRFWIRRYVAVMGAVFGMLSIFYMLQGQPPGAAAADAFQWSFISASIFIATRYYHASKGRPCAMCQDTPES